MDKKLLGRFGEEQAARYLKKKKYKIIGMNYSCRFGEIDIIAEDKLFTVFVEVKLRKNAAFAQAREFVTAAKQQRVMTAAQLWLSLNPTEKQPRFDVIEVYAPEGNGGEIQINHIENAF
ncbi:MAG: YraN family protein [Ruminococcaceae bacterium]|nr:YraN family protein [Oscillospiraceae bacterium]